MGRPHPDSWYEPGRKYNRLEIIHEVPKRERKKTNVRELLCKCDCGNVIRAKASSVFIGNTKSCGCIWKESLHGRAKYNIIGQKFGRLTAKKEVRKNGCIHFKCKCDCGKETTVNVYNLIRGCTKSCGCLQKESLKRQTNKITEDITGQVFGELTAIRKVDSYISTNGGSLTRWLYRCSCGREIVAFKANVKKGMIVNCGHSGRSIAEYDITKWLSNHGILYEKEASFDDLRNPKSDRKLYFDYKIYRNDGTFFLIEHQGIQHFEIRGNKKFGELQRELTDKLKKNYCEQHDITLYETLYNEDYISRLEDILTNELDKEVVSNEHSGEG